jgi:hypothetical protein
MNMVPAPLLRKTMEEHAQLLWQVLALLHQHQLKVKHSKCAFA